MLIEDDTDGDTTVQDFKIHRNSKDGRPISKPYKTKKKWIKLFFWEHCV